MLQTRRDLRQSGSSDSAIGRAAQADRLRRVRRGIYVSAPQEIDLLVRCRAIRLARPDAVVMLEAAAVLWSLPTSRRLSTIDISVPSSSGSKAGPDATVHRMLIATEDCVVRGELHLTSVERTVFDLCRHRERTQALVTVDAACRIHPGMLERLLRRASAQTGRGAARARATLLLADPGSGSPLETEFRLLFHDAALPAPESQYPVVIDGEVWAVVDFAWPQAKLLVEIDGFSAHSDRRAFDQDRRRMNRLVAAGWIVLRFTAADLRNPPAVIAAISGALSRAAA